MLILQNINYTHPNKDLLFSNINLTVNQHQKIALVGNNGVGKSTLLKIIAQEKNASSGELKATEKAYYVPQIFGQYNELTIAQALVIDKKLQALQEILSGNATETNFSILNDDWTIEERCNEALAYWQLNNLDLNQKIESLSGGQKTKVFMAGIIIHQPKLILLDEPSNHLDNESRKLLYDFIQSSKSTFLIVSHDRKLLNHLNTICELNSNGITVYSGNYDFYIEQKEIKTAALNQDIHSKEKALKKAKKKARETTERQQKLDARGKGKQEKSGVSRIMMNTLRNKAENSTSKLKNTHSEKIESITQDLHQLRKTTSSIDKMKIGFDNSNLHKGKILVNATEINFSYQTQNLWKENLNFKIVSGERIALKGTNGSGKTTLLKLILGNLNPDSGNIYKSEYQSVYIDQDYSLINNNLKIYEQAQTFNHSALAEHDIKMRLNRFLFTNESWDKVCNTLSGGERMRLMLCCLTINPEAHDLIILDEPTNNLDIQNIEILTQAVNEYQGTLIVVSHDDSFLEQINIQRTLQL